MQPCPHALQAWQPQESRELFAEAFGLADQLENHSILTLSMIGFAYIYLDSGAVESAGRLCGFALKLDEKSPVRIEPPDQKDVDWVLAKGREIGGDKFESAMAEGSGMTMEEVRVLVKGAAINS